MWREDFVRDDVFDRIPNEELRIRLVLVCFKSDLPELVRREVTSAGVVMDFTTGYAWQQTVENWFSTTPLIRALQAACESGMPPLCDIRAVADVMGDQISRSVGRQARPIMQLGRWFGLAANMPWMPIG